LYSCHSSMRVTLFCRSCWWI